MSPLHDPRLHLVFRTIGRCRLGREVLEAFLPLLRTGQVELEWVEAGSEILQRLGPKGGTHAVSGAYLWQSERRQKIVIQIHAVPEVQAAILLHEMIHATDRKYRESFAQSERLWKEFRAVAEEELARAQTLLGKPVEEILGLDLPREARLRLVRLKAVADHWDSRRLLETERRAYRGVLAWITELRETAPQSALRLEDAKRDGYRFDRLPSDEELQRAIGLTEAANTTKAA